MDPENTVLDNDELIVIYDYIPELIQQDMQPVGPNPLQSTDVATPNTPETATH